MKKNILLIGFLLLILTGCAIAEELKQLSKTDIIVPTMQDQVSNDGIWVGTFQLVWNDLKNEVVKQNIEIENEFARNLNEEKFTESDISNEYYYKKYGKASLELKNEIEKGIKDKFNQESDILDQLDWTNNNYIFYAMLYREFEFENKFDVLSNTDFGHYFDIKFFGISRNSNKKLKDQVKILFYENDQNFAISLKTKSGDEVIMYKNPLGLTFEEMYENMEEKKNNYSGNNYMGSEDEFKAPMLSINYLRDYEELKNKPFSTFDGTQMLISDALQTIRFDLNEKGGKVKSEAAIGTKEMAIANSEAPKKLYLNDTFALFLKEENKDKPYLAAKIADITKFQ